MGRMFVRTPAMDATVPKDEVWLRSDVPVKPDEDLEKLAETMIKKNPRNACIGCRFFTQGRYGRGKCGVNRDLRTIDDTCSSFKPRMRVGVILVNPYLPTPPVAGPRRPTGYNPGRIRIGDVVTVTHPGDRPGTRYTRKIRVEGGDEKDGKPVIDGVIVSSTDPHDRIGENAWAYEYQIVGRNPTAPTTPVKMRTETGEEITVGIPADWERMAKAWQTMEPIYQELFKGVQDKANWKMPLGPVHFDEYAPAQLMADAIAFYHGGSEIDQAPDGGWIVSSKGYYEYLGG